MRLGLIWRPWSHVLSEGDTLMTYWSPSTAHKVHLNMHEIYSNIILLCMGAGACSVSFGLFMVLIMLPLGYKYDYGFSKISISNYWNSKTKNQKGYVIWVKHAINDHVILMKNLPAPTFSLRMPICRVLLPPEMIIAREISARLSEKTLANEDRYGLVTCIRDSKLRMRSFSGARCELITCLKRSPVQFFHIHNYSPFLLLLQILFQ